MSKSIKPIPTFYDGIMFRSKLEARWAYFFNLCKIKWQYELEGYEVDDKRYLPDFYLPETKIHIEVKPNLNFLEDEYVLKKVVAFSKASKESFLVFVDTPVKAKYYSFKFGFLDIHSGKPSPAELHLVWLQNRKGQFHPHYYAKGLEAEDYFFELASNHRF